MRIEPAPDRTLVLDEIPRAIYRAGFDPDQLRISANGRVERGPEGLGFHIDGWPQAIPLAEAWSPGEGKQHLEAQVVLTDGKLLLVQPPELPPEAVDLRLAAALGQEIVN